jgi:ATP-dependent Clp protease ATP-binding subunit ClpA
MLIPVDQQTRKVLELIFREALRMGHNYIRTEHILLTLAEFENGTRALADLGIDKAAAEAHITAAVAAALAVREQKQQAGRRSGLPGYPGVSHRGSRRANLPATPT